MKFQFYGASALAFGLAFSHHAFAEKIECNGDSTQNHFVLHADWIPGQALSGLSLSRGEQKTFFLSTPLKQYSPRAKAYQGFNRFELTSDGWSTLSLLLPAIPESEFMGFYYSVGEHGEGVSQIHCKII